MIDRDAGRALDSIGRRMSIDRDYFDRYGLEISPYAFETGLLKSLTLEASRIVVDPTSRAESIAFASVASEVLHELIHELKELK